MSTRSTILNDKEISQKINRLAWEVYENNLEEKEIVIVGISGRGKTLASKLSQVLNDISGIKIKLATIYLDKENPYQTEVITDLNKSDYTNKVVVLIDDVLNSGKTLMYASKFFLTTPLIRLSTLVLVERAHTCFPVKADYVGLSLFTTLQEYITVVLDKDTKGVYLS